VSRSYRRSAVVGIALLTAAVMPFAATPAFASTDVVAAPLPAPTGMSPADNPDTFPQAVHKDIVLSWNAVAGATGYRVEIGRDDTWSDTPLASYDVTTTVLPLPQGLAYATYAWRVAALKGSVVGHWTSESTNSQNRAQFTKAWRQSPGSVQVSLSTQGVPTFSWTAVTQASHYDVAVSLNPIGGTEFDKVPTGGFVCGTTRNRLTPVIEGGDYAEGAADAPVACKMDLKASTTYYWGVRGVDEAVTDGGPERTFAVAGTSFTTPATAETVVPGSSPAISSFGSDPEHLCSITNVTPERALCTDVPTIRWSAVANAHHYEVLLSPDSLFQSVVDSVQVASTQWTPQRAWAEMSPSMAMYVAVRACGDADPDLTVTNYQCRPVSFANAPSFRKVMPRLSGLTTPTPTGRLAFSWTSLATLLAAAEQPSAGPLNTASQDAKGYHLQVAAADDPSFASSVLDVLTDAPVTDAGRFTSPGGPSYIPTSELPDGSYLWRVQAVDSGGNKLPWSQSKAFSRDTTAPRLVSVTPSSKVSTTGALKLVFSEPVTGVSASSVTVTPGAPMSVTVTSPTTATMTPTSPLRPGATYTLVVGSAVTDAVGNTAVSTGPHITVNPLTDDGNPAISYTSGWRVLSATNAVGGHFHSATPTSTVHMAASMVFRGTGVAVTSCLGPANGYVDTYVDGVRKAHTSTYRSYSGCGIKIVGVGGLARTQHTVRIVAVGTHSSASKGTTVALDAFTVTP
jgi:hypothetical protein